MTDEQTVERVARAIGECDNHPRSNHIDMARAAIAAMGEDQRYGNVKYATIRRDFNRLRTAIREWNAEETEKAWGKCERWLEAIAPSRIATTDNEEG